MSGGSRVRTEKLSIHACPAAQAFDSVKASTQSWWAGFPEIAEATMTLVSATACIDCLAKFVVGNNTAGWTRHDKSAIPVFDCSAQKCWFDAETNPVGSELKGHPGSKPKLFADCFRHDYSTCSINGNLHTIKTTILKFSLKS